MDGRGSPTRHSGAAPRHQDEAGRWPALPRRDPIDAPDRERRPSPARLARKPPWLRVRAPAGASYVAIKGLVRELSLHTVCEEAHCPNVGECWGSGTATFMVMGDTCTRGCRFCAVTSGNPRGALDPDEPRRVAEAVAGMRLRYVVITSVDRDDLPDHGAAHFAGTIRAIKERDERVRVESLIPDFGARRERVETILAARGDVVAHNLEVTRALTPRLRDRRCDYDLSLRTLGLLKELEPGLLTKSSLMVGLGETFDEIVEALRDLRGVGVDIITIGQYLRPTPRHHPVIEYITPDRFAALQVAAEELGFGYVASGPLVRSSYRAAELYAERRLAGRETSSSLGREVHA
ncbi:MAG: lipoyl synthase [Planctomycetota bacterium]